MCVAIFVGMCSTCPGIGTRFELDLEQNRVKDTGVQALRSALKDISGGVKLELLLHGNPFSQAACQVVEVTVDGETAADDPRLAFRSKAEGLLW
jgi:hypothetical protein